MYMHGAGFDARCKLMSRMHLSEAEGLAVEHPGAIFLVPQEVDHRTGLTTSL
jgi:hypothetical protein